MTNQVPRSGQPVYETPAESRFRAEMIGDGFSDDEVDAAIVDTRPAVSPFAAASDAAASGALPYGLGFISYLPIPFLNLIITGVVMAAVYPGQRRKSPLAAENARRAANWGLTVIAARVVMVVLCLGVIAIVHGTENGQLGLIPLLIYPAVGVAHLVVIINGLAKAKRGAIFENPIAIPFLR